MGGNLNFTPPPPGSLTILLSPLLPKIERKFQLDELLSIYAEKLLYLKFLTLSNKVEKCLCIRFVCLSVCQSVCPSVHARALKNILHIS